MNTRGVPSSTASRGRRASAGGAVCRRAGARSAATPGAPPPPTGHGPLWVIGKPRVAIIAPGSELALALTETDGGSMARVVATHGVVLAATGMADLDHAPLAKALELLAGHEVAKA